MKGRIVGTVVVALVFLTAYILGTSAALGASSHRSTGHPVLGMKKIHGAKNLHIAYFIGGTNNTYVQANMRGATATAKRIGASIHTYTSNWDEPTQANELQTALSSNQYNAWAVELLDPNQLCAFVRQAIAKGIVVAVINQALCHQSTWMPGTLTFVGGQTIFNYNDWLKWIFNQNPQGGKVAILSGPNLNANTDNFNAALKTQLKTHSKVQVLSNQVTDYTTATSFKITQDVLQAHPDLNIIIDNYSEIGKGVVSAIQAAGKLGKIKVYDYGGNSWAVSAVKNGQLQSTFPMLPYHETEAGILALRDYANGKPVPHFINLVKSLKFPNAPFVTKGNVKFFKAEY